MHEAGLMASVLGVIDASCREHNIRQVSEIVLQVGVLNGALPDALRFAFDALRRDYPWCNASTALRIERVEARLDCLECSYQGPSNSIVCPRCQSVLSRWIHGDEFHLLGYEGETG